MSESPAIARPLRRRSTHAVLSDIEMLERWWAPQQSPAPVELRRRHSLQFRSGDPLERFRWARYGLAALSLIIPGILLYRMEPVQTYLHKLRFDPKLVAARCFAQGKPEEAVAPLRMALLSSPNDLTLLRQLARAAARHYPAEARRCYNRIERLGATQNEDRAAHASLLAELHDFRGAKAVLSKVSADAKNSDPVLRAWLDIWREVGDFASALDVLKRINESNGASLEPALKLAEAASRNSTPVELLSRIEKQLTSTLQAAAKSHLTELIRASATRLASLAWRNTETRLEVADLLRTLPGNPPEYRMAAVRLQFSAEPNGTEREALKNAWFDEINACGGLSAEEKARVATYLQQQGEHELVADLISAPEALSETTLYVRRTESLLELGRWKEVGGMAAEAVAPTLPQSRVLMQSLASLYKPGPKTCMADRLLADSFNESREEKRASACFSTGCAALDHRLPVLASQAFATALDLSRDRKTLMEAVLSKTRQSSLTIVQLLRSLEGSATNQDESVQNQLIYLHLLAGRDLDSMRELIHNRRTMNPADVYLRFLDAFETHQRGELTQAAHMLVPLPRYRWHQGEAAVIASIIAATGSYERSASLVGQIDSAKLFPEEQALLAPWQQRIAASSQVATNIIEAPKP